MTHPRNAGRSDLRCPFGCRQSHRLASSTIRSIQYYQTPEGKKKKQQQNGRRTEKTCSDALEPEAVSNDIAGLDAIGLQYLQTVLSLLEKRLVGRQEIVLLLRKKMRQHSIGKSLPGDYTLRDEDKKPP